MPNIVYTIPKKSSFSLLIGKINHHWFCGLVVNSDNSPLLLIAFGKYFAKKLDYPYIKLLFQKIPSLIRTEYFLNQLCFYEAFDLNTKQVQKFLGIIKGYAESHHQVLSGWLPDFKDEYIELIYSKNIIDSAIIGIKEPALFQSFQQIYAGNTCRESMLNLASSILGQLVSMGSCPRFGEFKLSINYQFYQLMTLDNFPRNSLIHRPHPKSQYTCQVFYKYRHQAKWLFDYKQDTTIASLFDTYLDSPDNQKLKALFKKGLKDCPVQSGAIFSLPAKTGFELIDKVYQRLLEIASSGKKDTLSIQKFNCLKTFFYELKEKKIYTKKDVKTFSQDYAQAHQDILFKHRKSYFLNFLFKTKTEQLFDKLQEKPCFIYAFFCWLYQKITELCHHLQILVIIPSICP